ncbi:MAG: hypothetical protein LBI11_01905 [Streptococcaceae bacterium]|jgi:hypothetical protein|nr:hypothetical protein [Streptococcaceae bacterium]
MSEKQKKSFFGNLFGGDEPVKLGSTPESTSQESEKQASDETLDAPFVSAQDQNNEEKTPEQVAQTLVPTREHAQSLQSMGADYNQELTRYQKHLETYRQEKTNYDQILNEYELAAHDFQAKLGDFLPDAKEMKDTKGLYDVDLSDYNNHRYSYNEALAAYDFSRKEQTEVSEKSQTLKIAADSKNAEVESVTEEATKIAETYETAVNVVSTRTQELTEKKADFDAKSTEMEELSDKHQQLTEEINAEKPVFEDLKNRFEYADQLTNEYTTLSDQAKQMQEQEESAQSNFDEIRQVRRTRDDEVEVRAQIDQFSTTPLVALDAIFKDEKQKFETLAAHYDALKARYDQESANFVRIKKNYDDLNQSESINSVALHYVTEEFESAGAAMREIEASYLPVEKDYLKQKTIFEALNKNYMSIKEMASEARVNKEAAQNSALEAQRTYAKVEEAYRFVATENAMLKQNLATKEAQYNEIKDDYDALKWKFEEEKELYEPLSEAFQEAQRALRSAVLQTEKAHGEEQAAESALRLSENALEHVTQELAEAQKNLQQVQKEQQMLVTQNEAIEEKTQEVTRLVEQSLATANERYALTASKFQKVQHDFETFSQKYTNYTPRYHEVSAEFTQISSLYRLSKDEYATLERAYQSFDEHRSYISSLYEKVMSDYAADKDYYDSVYSTYSTVKASREEVLSKKKTFDVAAQNLKAMLVDANSLTFPIYEATGQNYVDRFNLPAVRQTAGNVTLLENKSQLNAWVSLFTSVRETLGHAASELSSALTTYQGDYNAYLSAGGERLRAIETNSVAYAGIDLGHYLAEVDTQVEAWKGDYTEREHAFAALAVAYSDYLDSENQLLNLVATSDGSQGGVQSVVNMINSIPDYLDMYSSTYGDISMLAQHLGVTVQDLTRPRTAPELQALVQENYYNRSVALIQANISGFVQRLNGLRASYETNLTELRRQLGIFSASTGIATNQIQVNSVLNDDINLADYLATGLTRNTEKLQAAVSDISSFVNLVKRSGQLNKVANRTIDSSADTTLVLPDKPIHMSQELLNTEITVNDLRMVPIPIEPDKPTEVEVAPISPTTLADMPEFVENAKSPETIQTP